MRHIDWEKTSKETCIEIIEGLQEDLKRLRVQYDERGAAMGETGRVVRSLYEPKIRQMIDLWKQHQVTKMKTDGSHFQVDVRINALIEEFKNLVGYRGSLPD